MPNITQCFFSLRDRPTKKMLSPKPHILDSIGMSGLAHFGRRGLNHLNLKILFVLWDLKRCRTSDVEGRLHGTSRDAAQTSRGGPIGPQGAAHLRPRGEPPIAMVPRGASWDLEVLWCHPLRSVRHPSRSHGAAP